MDTLHLGTCSWKYESWEGLVYEKGSDLDYLSQYAHRYDTVEVDQWFWSLGKQSYALPDPSVVHAYDLATPGTFRFTIKCPNSLTIVRDNPWFLDAQVFYRFLERLTPLMEKIGLFMFQFAYLNQSVMQSRDVFEERLAAFFSLLPDNLPYGIEIRNPAWLDERWFSFLDAHMLHPILLSGYWMEPLMPALDLVAHHASPVLCVRLHGDDRKGIEMQTASTWDALAKPMDKELVAIAPKLVALAQQGKIIYVNVNNHYEGSAPLTIGKLIAYLEACTK
ncbi:MAG: DUF72 domain-containing protein [Sphaerochaeta sp.]|uniref:DUF72 domain-containing protein n=1 Tax=Sphaerochaeta sp. TaxID=1972642 RepID=UPI002FC68131